MKGKVLRSASINCPLCGSADASKQIACTADLIGTSVLFVRPGPGPGDGSRQRPYSCLQLAIDAAQSGDVIVVADPQRQLDESVLWPDGKRLRIYAGFRTDFASRSPLRINRDSVLPIRRLSPPAMI